MNSILVITDNTSNFNYTLPESYLDTFSQVGLFITSPFTTAKAHTPMQCIAHGHQFTATPISKVQTRKKFGDNYGCCPVCSKMRKLELVRPARQIILDNLAARGIFSLDGYDGGQNLNSYNVRMWKNIRCGHEFKSQVGHLITGPTKPGKTNCTVCGILRRAAVNTRRNLESSQKWAINAPERLLYYSIVDRITTRSYTKYKSIINPNNLPRVRAGSECEGGQQLDHIIPRVFGFTQGLDPRLIGSHHNLQMLPWRTNLSKKAKLLTEQYTLPTIFEEFIDSAGVWSAGQFNTLDVLNEITRQFDWWGTSDV